MADLSDGFIMLPGGFGTLEEFFEALTWTQLGVHSKPCAVLDVNGFFDPLHVLFDAAVSQGFVRSGHRNMIISDSDPASLLDRMSQWKPVLMDKWIDRSQR